jgi:hypothetical protein
MTHSVLFPMSSIVSVPTSRCVWSPLASLRSVSVTQCGSQAVVRACGEAELKQEAGCQRACKSHNAGPLFYGCVIIPKTLLHPQCNTLFQSQIRLCCRMIISQIHRVLICARVKTKLLKALSPFCSCPCHINSWSAPVPARAAGRSQAALAEPPVMAHQQSNLDINLLGTASTQNLQPWR